MAAQALKGIRVLDLTRRAGRALGGTQLLGDSAPTSSRSSGPAPATTPAGWGPPYARGRGRADTAEAAYYLGANRNKRSVTIDIAQPEGQRLVRELLGGCDVVVGELQGRRP